MTCPECGSPEGDQFRICQECIDRKRAEKMQVRDGIVNPVIEETDKVSAAIGSKIMWFLATVIFVLCIFIYLLFYGPILEQGVYASFLFSCAVSASLLGILTWFFFWLRMLTFDPIWALVSLIIPCFAYRYVWINWDDKKTRLLFFVHILVSASSFLFCTILANHLNISVIGVFLVFKAYMGGYPISLDELMMSIPPSP